MAKIFLSPLIIDLRNKVADVVFSKWRGINYARSRVVPANPQTAAQQSVRNSLARLVDFWQHLTTGIKNAWDYLAKGKEYSGYNLFVGHNRVTEQNLQLIDESLDTGLSQNLTVFDASSPVSGEIQISFSPSPVPAGFKLVIIGRTKPTDSDKKTTFATAEYDEGTASPITVSGFPSGVTYQVYGVLVDKTLNRAGKSMADEVTVT